MLPLIEWSEDYVLGVKVMDEHHKRLIEILNDCCQALVLNDHHRELEGVIGELLDYTCYHFGSEEKLMAELGYRGAEAHVRVHGEFVEMIEKVRNRWQNGESLVAVEIMQFLQSWLTGHIQKTDASLAALIREKGLAGTAG